jgi:hypothetical protein
MQLRSVAVDTRIGPKERKYLYAPQNNWHNIRNFGCWNLCLEIQRNPIVPAMNHVALGNRRRVRCLLGGKTNWVIGLLFAIDRSNRHNTHSSEKIKIPIPLQIDGYGSPIHPKQGNRHHQI